MLLIQFSMLLWFEFARMLKRRFQNESIKKILNNVYSVVFLFMSMSSSDEYITTVGYSYHLYELILFMTIPVTKFQNIVFLCNKAFYLILFDSFDLSYNALIYTEIANLPAYLVYYAHKNEKMQKYRKMFNLTNAVIVIGCNAMTCYYLANLVSEGILFIFCFIMNLLSIGNSLFRLNAVYCGFKKSDKKMK
jgi:hypothetical protein